MRDVYRNYEIIENSNSLSAGIFPPLWLAYSQKWWVLFLFLAIMAVSLCKYIYFFIGLVAHLIILLQSSTKFTI